MKVLYGEKRCDILRRDKSETISGRNSQSEGLATIVVRRKSISGSAVDLTSELLIEGRQKGQSARGRSNKMSKRRMMMVPTLLWDGDTQEYDRTARLDGRLKRSVNPVQ